MVTDVVDPQVVHQDEDNVGTLKMLSGFVSQTMACGQKDERDYGDWVEYEFNIRNKEFGWLIPS